MTVEQIKEFKDALHNGVVEFKYNKVNGEERTARGTLHETAIVEAGGSLPKGAGIEMSDAVVRYFDLNSNGWRSFKVENFVGII